MNQLLGLGFAVLLAGFTAANYFHKDTAFSDTENRMLQQKPVFSWADLADGRFMGNFEKYQTDQFILRREWIRLQTAADRLLGKINPGMSIWARDSFWRSRRSFRKMSGKIWTP